jgi:hypothetical protein
MASQNNTVSRDTYSNIYLATYDPADICAHLSIYDFNRLFSNAGGLMAIKIYNENDEFRICTVGAPHENDKFKLYVPASILEDLNIKEKENDNENVWFEPILDDIPLATQITIKPYNDSLFAYDLADILQQELDKYYILQEGITIRLKIFDEEHLVHIAKIEPAPICRLGGEVAIDIREPIIPSEVIPSEVIPSEVINRADKTSSREDDTFMNEFIEGLGDALPGADDIPGADEIHKTLPGMWWKHQEWGNGHSLQSAADAAAVKQAEVKQPSAQQQTAAELRAARLRFFESRQQSTAN